mgnify:CR=1 FL=1
MKKETGFIQEGLLKVYDSCKKDKNKIVELEDKGMNIIKECLVYGQLRMAEWFIDNGANVNIIDNEDKTTLSYACEFGNTNLIKKILEKSSMESIEKSYSMYYAVRSGNIEHLDMLLSIGYSIDEVTPDGDKLLISALRAIDGDMGGEEERKKQLIMVDYLVKHGASLDRKVKKELKRLSGVDLLINTGILVHCYKFNLYDLLVFFIKNGVSAHKQNMESKNTFEFFIKKEEIEIIELILEHSSPMEIQHTSALVAARNNLEIVRILLENGVRTTYNMRYNSKPILNYIAYYIERYYSKEFVEVLLENGADVNTKNYYNWTPIVELLVIREGNEEEQKEFFDLLMRRNPTIDDTDISNGFIKNELVHINDVLDVAIYQNRYDWFEPYLPTLPEETQELFESKRFKKLMRMDKEPISLGRHYLD